MQIVKDAVGAVLSFSSDVIVILILIGLGTAYALMMGKRKATSLLFSLYLAAFLFRFIPFLGKNQEIFTQIAAFVIILIPIHITLNQFIATEFSFSRLRKFIESLCFGIVLTSTLILFSYQVINIKSIYNFGVGVDALFSVNLIFWWLLLPFALLFTTRK